ncbi:MAG: InlB B-repeat-containing protein [Bacteroidales bacterium]|nr:InlB B-repeat-containing protein [Bacteroidales bacterium]
MKKKLLFATMVSVAMAFGFTSCSEDEDEEFSTDQYTISFDANGGTGDIAPVVIRVGDYLALPTDGVSKAGKDFAGWSRTPNGDKVTFFVVQPKNETLYALWTDHVETLNPDVNHSLEVEATAMVAQAWDNQFWIMSDTKFKEGDKWEFSMYVKAKKEATIGTQTHKAAGEYIHWAGVGSVPFTTEWTKFEATGSFTSEQNDGYSIAFNLNDFAEANVYYFDDISLKIGGKEVVVNGNLESPDGNVAAFKAKEKNATGADDWPVSDGRLIEDDSKDIEMKGEAPVADPSHMLSSEKDKVFVVEATAKVADPWDNQFWIVSDVPFKAGESYYISMDVKAAEEATVETQTHVNPSEYIHYVGIGNVKFTTEWSTYTYKGTFSAEQDGGLSFAFNLNSYEPANTYYFKNIVLILGNMEGGETTFKSKEKGGSEIVDSRNPEE